MRLIRLWPENSHFDFMRFRRFSFPLSALISIATAIMLMTMGLNFGIDFTGGTLMEIQAKSGQANVAQIRQTAEGFGFGEVEVQEFGTAGEVSLRFPTQPGGEAAQTAVVQKARDTFGNEYDFRRVETVGPRVSGELVQSGWIFTTSLRCAGRCRRSVMARRARVPTSLIIAPPLPRTIARWLSRSTTMLAEITTSASRSFHSSMTTATA